MNAGLPERVVLLPNENGSPSAIVVTRRTGGSVELSQPYAQARVSRDGLLAQTSSPSEVAERYRLLLAVQPQRVKSYLLYFEFNRAELTASSRLEVERILAEAAVTPAAEVDVIGHTDSRGTLRYNDKLGQSRAQYVAALMAQRGFNRLRLAVLSRGEREPLVPTRDDTEEPQNRRVEIRLR